MGFIEKRNSETLARTEKILDKNPPFLAVFINAISQKTSPLTRLNYASDISAFLGFMKENLGREIKTAKDLESLSVHDIEVYLAFLSKMTERSVARKVSALKNLFKYFLKIGEIEKNVMEKIDAPKIHDKEIIRLDKDESRELIDAPDELADQTEHQRSYTIKTSARDKMIIVLFLATGIRISELAALNICDINFKDNSFRVQRKGGNVSILYMPDFCAEELKSYLGERVKNIAEPLFLSLKTSENGAKRGDQRLLPRAIQNVIYKYARVVSPLKKISPHKLRSTFGTNLYEAVQDIYVVAEVLGHKDVNTTRKHYAHMSEEIKKQASKSVQL
ncbi:MAG: tyrosine-type recombinase/integrase [Christensenellaceae bacterium]|jgi:site-specific recombinase XerD|nr:tyrosine-type recombinase/integrase [Christensenellaceae bacterium]